MHKTIFTGRGGPAFNADGGEDELSMPMVISDVFKPPQPRIGRPLSSVVADPQTPSSTRPGQQTALSAAEPSPSPSQMQLAVHIRSSPITPFTPINASASRDPSTLPARLGRNRGRPARSQTPNGPPTPNPLTDLGVKAEALAPRSEPKKRGRPKGWKPGLPYTTDPNSRYRKKERRAAEAQGQERATAEDKGRSQNQEVKRRGRPPRPLEPSVREWYLRSSPDYIPFKCEWDLSKDSQQQGSVLCPAELQNMDTLRKHVFFIHGDGAPLICRFSHCKDHNPPPRFETEDEFKHHMETKHFAVYLWHLGEGYQNKGIESLKSKSKSLPAYLFDRKGNQVTPSVAGQRLESDIQRKERKRKLRKIWDQQNENAPTEEEWIKQMLGIAENQ
ncbi:hypothetical protein NUW58_g5377 [Xylaria curta]|uniref:Uncharacterized protein n=1 Tax=Xylaria curta TaxID=42375 RepID=A0ACC1P3F3_9PEZI|nr:hypothetical protein NUW58_g5377 [Xylaria curta]